LFRTVNEVEYFECLDCEFIFAHPDTLQKADEGLPTRSYDSAYWHSQVQAEVQAARDRAFGDAMARVAETILYARRPVRRFLDVYTGPGYLLDAVQRYLPHVSKNFFGVELFPPPSRLRTLHPNYRIGDVSSLDGRFQAGLCMEVLEHLTPMMARKLAFDLATISDPEAIFLINTGLVRYVKTEDPGYLDPIHRGHITIWSVAAARRIFEPEGFSVFPIMGKNWAFVVEWQSRQESNGTINERIWSPDPENKAMLSDSANGSLMYILGLETARAGT
jgi:hypothetical protein